MVNDPNKYSYTLDGEEYKYIKTDYLYGDVCELGTCTPILTGINVILETIENKNARVIPEYVFKKLPRTLLVAEQ